MREVKGIIKKPKSVAQILRKPTLLSPSEYDSILNHDLPIEKKKRWSEQKKQIVKKKVEEEKRKLRAERLKTDKSLQNQAKREKLHSIYEWAQKEYPSIWRRLFFRILEKDIILRGKRWNPSTLVSYDDMEKIKSLHNENPHVWSNLALAHKFKISTFAVRRILKSRHIATAEKIVHRDEVISQFNYLSNKLALFRARSEHSRLFEEDLKSRYGSLYVEPNPHNTALYKIINDPNYLKDLSNSIHELQQLRSSPLLSHIDSLYHNNDTRGGGGGGGGDLDHLLAILTDSHSSPSPSPSSPSSSSNINNDDVVEVDDDGNIIKGSNNTSHTRHKVNEGDDVDEEEEEEEEEGEEKRRGLSERGKLFAIAKAMVDRRLMTSDKYRSQFEFKVKLREKLRSQHLEELQFLDGLHSSSSSPSPSSSPSSPPSSSSSSSSPPSSSSSHHFLNFKREKKSELPFQILNHHHRHHHRNSHINNSKINDVSPPSPPTKKFAMWKSLPTPSSHIRSSSPPSSSSSSSSSYHSRYHNIDDAAFNSSPPPPPSSSSSSSSSKRSSSLPSSHRRNYDNNTSSSSSSSYRSRNITPPPHGRNYYNNNNDNNNNSYRHHHRGSRNDEKGKEGNEDRKREDKIGGGDEANGRGGRGGGGKRNNNNGNNNNNQNNNSASPPPRRQSRFFKVGADIKRE